MVLKKNLRFKGEVAKLRRTLTIEIEIGDNTVKRLKVDDNQQYQFPLDRNKYKLLYELCMGAEWEEFPSFMVGESFTVVKRLDTELHIFPFAYFKNIKELQLEVDASFELLNRSRACEMENIIQLKKVIANQKYIAFEVERLPFTLREVLADYELSGVLKKQIAVAVFAGIQQVSKLGFVHGDISLDNIFLSRTCL